MVSQVYNGKKYSGRDLLDVAMMIADDQRDAERQARRNNHRPYVGQGCSEDRKLRYAQSK